MTNNAGLDDTPLLTPDEAAMVEAFMAEAIAEARVTAARLLGDKATAAKLLAEVVDGGKIGDHGLWALRAAADAARTEGVSGVIIVKIPKAARDFVEVDFHSGVSEVSTRRGA